MAGDREWISMGKDKVGVEATLSKEFENTEALFKNTSAELTKEYLEFWASACDTFLQAYGEAKVDGTQDGLRLRMLAAMRLAQLGLSMFSFFSSCALSIKDGAADAEACNATAKVVSMMVENKTDDWITRAKRLFS